MRIPFGQTRSYKGVAAAIGSPQSARAVGAALHHNPCAPYIPCHRVVASDGTLGGYNLGLKKKIELLKKEKYFSSRVSCKERENLIQAK